MNTEQKDVLMRAGTALLLAQSAEEVIRMCMTYVLQKDGPLTIEKLERQTREERKRTLGYFLGELRKRAGLDNELDVLLEAFLDERNTLVHHLTDIPGWSLATAEGRKVARGFLDNFILKAIEVQKVLVALVWAWQEDVGIENPVPHEHEFFVEIETRYKARLDNLFFEKDS